MRTVQYQWILFKKRLLPNAPSDQILYDKRVFYSGAFAMLALVKEVIENDDLGTEATVKILNGFWDELESFAENIGSKSEATELDKDQYPDGKLSEDDDGATVMALSIEQGRVIVTFQEPTKWIGIPPDGALDFAKGLIKCAMSITKTPFTIEIG